MPKQHQTNHMQETVNIEDEFKRTPKKLTPRIPSAFFTGRHWINTLLLFQYTRKQMRTMETKNP